MEKTTEDGVGRKEAETWDDLSNTEYKGNKLIKIFDRDEHIRTHKDGLVTGIRFVYKAENPEPCETCGGQTTRVIDYLGKLEFQCHSMCGIIL